MQNRVKALLTLVNAIWWIYEKGKSATKNAWLGHYPKGSTVSKIGLFFLEELFRVFFISNEWCLKLLVSFQALVEFLEYSSLDNSMVLDWHYR